MEKKLLKKKIGYIGAVVILFLLYQFLMFTTQRLGNNTTSNNNQTGYTETGGYEEERKLKITRSDEMYYFELEVNETINNGDITKENKCETLIKLGENITGSISEIIEYKTNKILESKVLVGCDK